MRATVDLVGADEFLPLAEHVILKLWRFKTFSSGRWMSMQEACSGIARGILSGVDRVVQLVQADATEVSWYINGWDGLGDDGREFAFVGL